MLLIEKLSLHESFIPVLHFVVIMAYNIMWFWLWSVLNKNIIWDLENLSQLVFGISCKISEI